MAKARSAKRTVSFGEFFENLTERGLSLFKARAQPEGLTPDLVLLGEALLSRRGEASGVALAEALVEAYDQANNEQRLDFLKVLASRFGVDREAVLSVVAALGLPQADDNVFEELHRIAEPRRQELMRRLNLAPGGTAALVRMREGLLRHLPESPELRGLDADFAHLFNSWFNRGFLELRHIGWETPASILEKIIRYEAVHEIHNWEDLRNRLQPKDRRCYGFFHPQLVDEPLIFVEVALTSEIPDKIGPLLNVQREPIEAEDATTAVFYSISNTQRGLAGVSFGNFLIKQVVENLKSELPNIKTFVTLSPIPGFSRWLENERRDEKSAVVDAEQRQRLSALDNALWYEDQSMVKDVEQVLMPLARYYFLSARDKKNRPLDSVARFHLGNGARLERLNFMADLSPNGMRQSYGMMVNYQYDLGQIEKNHEAFLERGEIAAQAELRKLHSPFQAHAAVG